MSLRLRLALLFAVVVAIGIGIASAAAYFTTERALEQDCPLATEALDVFCNVFGTVAGNLALTLGARGGVYIGGGIIPRLVDFFLRSGRFWDHVR